MLGFFVLFFWEGQGVIVVSFLFLYCYLMITTDVQVFTDYTDTDDFVGNPKQKKTTSLLLVLTSLPMLALMWKICLSDDLSLSRIRQPVLAPNTVLV